ncbi:MAG TPA: M28 family peptidase [Polyangia bacterium]|nr:M28 family peptidase [Polyangia bacterium]
MFLPLRPLALASMIAFVTACQAAAPPPPATPAAAAAPAKTTAAPLPDEVHLGDLRQLTFGGENAEAYWSPNGAELIFQAHAPTPGAPGCDRIYRMQVTTPNPTPLPVSSGQGATTCAFFLPGTKDVIFSSTHLAGPACPPPPDRSHGYVWAIYPSYDIFRAGPDGSNLRRLTDNPGYDAEATTCSVDGSIIFTSLREGDLDLYRMDADGKNVRRLTKELGYDGGAVFDRDCTHIVWRAARPRTDAEREEYQQMLAQGLVRPTKLELWMADGDGGNAHQVTYLDAASFGPAFYPSASQTDGIEAERRIIFSSNHGDPKGREFDLWAIDSTGANLERVTTAPGFDGFPMFSPQSGHLAFASNRATPPGQHDTNVFVARWDEKTVRRFAETPADRILADIRWLASPEREGRGVGTKGLESSGTYMEAGLQKAGLKGAGEGGSYRQMFNVPTEVKVGAESFVKLGGVALDAKAFTPAAYSAQGQGIVRGPMVLAGYGIVDDQVGVNDYARLNVKGKVVVVRRFAPELPAFENGEAKRRAGDVRRKAFAARERGATALIVVDSPLPPPAARAGTEAKPGDTTAAAPGTEPWKMPDEAAFPGLSSQGPGDAGIPVVFVHRADFAKTLARLEKGGAVGAQLKVALSITTAPAFNVVARVPSEAPEGERLPGVVVLGAHYDHLGLGGRHSMEPDNHNPHVGADDNASGAATLIEAGRMLSARRAKLKRDVILVAFSGEEEGDLGSTFFTRSPPAPLAMKDVVAMVNLDMVGRLRDNQVTILGRGSAEEWPALIDPACAAASINCKGTSGPADGYGPSDQMPFAAAGVPVAHFFTGSHPDYHRPSDTPGKINASGAGQIALATANLIEAVANRTEKLTVKAYVAPPADGDMRSFGASLGTIPDYAGPPNGAPGVLLSGVRAGGPAEAAGLRRGDLLIRLGSHQLRSVEDFMYALGESKPGQTATAVVIRDGKEVSVKVTFQAGHRQVR